jgi:hypothetical protein
MKKVFFGWIFLAVFFLPTFANGVLAGSKTLKIAMVLWRGETEAEKGFRQGLNELGYSVQYTLLNAGQDRTELGRLLREDLKPKLDNQLRLFCRLDRNLCKVGSNIAGVTNEIPLALQIRRAAGGDRMDSPWHVYYWLERRAGQMVVLFAADIEYRIRFFC